MKRLLSSLALTFLGIWFCNFSQAGWLVERAQTPQGIKILSVKPKNLSVHPANPILTSLPEFLREDAPPNRNFERVYFEDNTLPSAYRTFFETQAQNSQFLANQPIADSEVRTIAEQGPKENRINLTMVGDGYTLAEKEKFFEDSARIKDELFTGSTFASYLPLFNVYAVFVPSTDSGLSDGQGTKNTALGLYRDPPGSKRAIMPGNTDAIDAAVALAPATDFPILIANDDFYGGLGGKYAITTRSPRSGIVVLRHELGHNFGSVGEEYDSGYVYRGANFSESAQVTWPQWLTQTPVKVYETLFLAGEYVWQNLSQGDFSSNFNFPQPNEKGPYQFEIIISSVGWTSPDDVSVELDGQKMNLEGTYTNDRSFFNFHLPQSPAPGTHTLTVHENTHTGEHVLAFAEIYANPGDFDWAPDHYAAFATYNDTGAKMGYRPTHESCLMRNMLTPHFCSVDLENMWTRFLNRISLVDALSFEQSTRIVKLTTPPLKGLEIHWFAQDINGKEQELTAHANQTQWVADPNLHGSLRAHVRFRTPEVRAYTAAFDVDRTVSIQ